MLEILGVVYIFKKGLMEQQTPNATEKLFLSKLYFINVYLPFINRNELATLSHQHNQEADIAALELLRFRNNVKQNALSSDMPPRKIIAKQLHKTPTNVHGFINTENVSRS